MATITITEALAELKTIDKRIDKQREFVLEYLLRPEKNKDPLLQQGGSAAQIQAKMQSINDLFERKVMIRRKINEANLANTITVGGMTRSIADWLTWRREVAQTPAQQRMFGGDGTATVSLSALLASMFDKIRQTREAALRQGIQVLAANVANISDKDIVVNYDEAQLSADREKLENTLGQLDGLFSLKNATLTIQLPD